MAKTHSKTHTASEDGDRTSTSNVLERKDGTDSLGHLRPLVEQFDLKTVQSRVVDLDHSMGVLSVGHVGGVVTGKRAIETAPTSSRTFFFLLSIHPDRTAVLLRSAGEGLCSFFTLVVF